MAIWLTWRTRRNQRSRNGRRRELRRAQFEPMPFGRLYVVNLFRVRIETNAAIPGTRRFSRLRRPTQIPLAHVHGKVDVKNRNGADQFADAADSRVRLEQPPRRAFV